VSEHSEGRVPERSVPTYRGRFAPSPTGHFHLGNARTALLAWLAARAARGSFILRVEDVDHTRCRPAYERAQLAQLRWLGLDWDEGPDVGGAFGPYRQSERSPLYAAAARRLTTYPCTCTRRELATLPRSSVGPIYPGLCLARGPKPDRPSALRWRVPERTAGFDDRVCGPQPPSRLSAFGDPVVRRSDGAWGYLLAVVVDDAAMQITEIVRGADLLTSTALQVGLYAELGMASPSFAHVPLWTADDGSKLSKRRQSPNLQDLIDAGDDPQVVAAELARSVGLVSRATRRVTPREMIADFDLRALLDRVR